MSVPSQQLPSQGSAPDLFCSIVRRRLPAAGSGSVAVARWQSRTQKCSLLSLLYPLAQGCVRNLGLSIDTTRECRHARVVHDDILLHYSSLSAGAR